VTQTAASSRSTDSHSAGRSCCQKNAAKSVSAASLVEVETQSETFSPAVEYVRATSPAHSTADCCCSQGKPVTDRASAVSQLSVSQIATIAPVLAVERDLLPLAVAVDMPISAGPPLRILHCVWRC
jgi:hypothetical protein